MAAEIGHFALILALMLAIVGSTLPHIGAARSDIRLLRLSDQSALLQFIMTAISFGALMYAFVTSDFSVLNVATNSHTDKPLLYKIAGVFASHVRFVTLLF